MNSLKSRTGIEYPVCIAGEKNCPPEDCGGTGRYFEFLEVIKNPFRMLRWSGGKFDPDHFDSAKIRFRNSEKRLRIVFVGEDVRIAVRLIIMAQEKNTGVTTGGY